MQFLSILTDLYVETVSLVQFVGQIVYFRFSPIGKALLVLHNDLVT